MTRKSLAFLSGLVIAAWCVSAAYSQAPPQRQTLAERIALLSRGWRQDEPKTEEPERVNTPSPQPRASSPTAGGEATRTAMQPRAGSVHHRTSLQEGFTLPGLGGSPLPGDAVAPKRPEPTPAIDVAREVVGDYPVIQPSRNVDPAVPTALRGGTIADHAGEAIRQSPQRRAAIQLDPEQLRRELAGAFPMPSASTAPNFNLPQPAPIDAASLDPTPAFGPDIDEEENETFAQPERDDTQRTTPPAAGSPTDPRTPAALMATPSNDASETLSPGAAVNEPQTRHHGAAAFGEESTADDSDLGFRLARPRTSPRAGVAPTPATASTSSPLTPSADRRREVFGDAASPLGNDPNLLVTHQTPVITTDIRGPKQILVGREATYRVRLQNQGQVAAEAILASIRIPSWADVIDTVATHGTIQQSRDAHAPGVLQWQLARLDAGAGETLDVRLVPRSSRPMELGVSWTLAPVGSRAVVEVQEPKLRLHVSGPEEVLFGKPQVYRMTLTNPGTGVAENVRIDLMPPGGGEDAVTSHTLGDLAAGASQSIDVELTAREAGKLYVNALASAEGGLTSEASKEIFCRKAELEVDWRGPENKYTGTEATYFLRVRNPGTAAAEDVTVTVSLPDGAELVNASEGQVFDAGRRRVAWRVGSLAPGDDYYMELKCLVKAPGRNEVKISAATAAGDLTDDKIAATNVIALADLKLEVVDPSGPVAVGDEAVYEIRVRNRGAGAAKDVNVVALFSHGVEPGTVEGAMYSIADGRVTFRAIDELLPGKEIVLRIRAHATQPGTHVFRAEVLCREHDIRLAAEETTRFYADDVFDTSSTAGRYSAGSSDGFAGDLR